MTENIRLLVCKQCLTVEDLPDYQGDPDNDVTLEYLLEKHVFPNGERHFGHLMNVESKWWEYPAARQQILKELGLTTGLGSETYACIETFKEDAAKCFTAHHRSIPCIDWRDDRKRIGNPTKIGWESGPLVYLCDYCVVASDVQTEINWEQGLYKKGRYTDE